MLTLVLLLAAAALLTWPGRATDRPRNRLLATVIGCVIALLTAFLALGPAGPVAVVVLAAAGRYFWRSTRTGRTQIAEAEGMAEAMRTMAAELNAGADPATAAEVAAVDSPPEVAKAVRAVAGAVHFGDDTAPANDDVGQLAHSWRLAHRHGLPMAGVLSAVRRDIDSSLRFARQAHAAMSGPRMSAVVLAALPVLGILLGEALGARPLHLLASTGLGQLLLLFGAGLLAAGVVWTARLTRIAS
ncbi:type II secretion system F family protein [Amycolatopsis sp. 195334CR]|uniref:type II secretion system F family protein n=1 Tax=Amycolatopsis sp. 195334CR TaxID=2814588 RepID=UPI001A8BFD99|nr:type II secretion system F family protein [Amycolatopsis sp. 195334CR]MBN6035124.1 type II secretion system F family protein [Amycolatopsis sp. 195334CR]